MKCKWCIPIIGLLASALLIGSTYAAWTFNHTYQTNTPITIVVPSWQFNLPNLQPGDIIIINNNGIVTVNGEEVEVALDFGKGGDDGYSGSSGATIELQIVVNADGSLSITTYDLKPNAALFGTNDGTAYFPQYLNVNGENVLITAIAEPVNFQSTRVWLVDSQVNHVVIPEGYQTICNRAFYDCALANNSIFNFPSTLTQIGSQIINVPRNNTWTINYNGTTQSWNGITKPNNWKAGQGTLRVVCSNGTLTY